MEFETLLQGRPRAVAGLCAAVVMAGCAVDADDPLEVGIARQGDPIVRPVGEATAHPYVCIIRMGSSGACSGSLVARNVVLTASHCVSGASSFTVTCPYSGDASAATGRESQMSPTGRRSFSGGYISPESGSDVALIRLDRDIRATRFATVRTVNVNTGIRAYVIGRINNGSFTNRLWVSPIITLAYRYGPGSPPYALGASSGLTQPGDSGGAIFDADTDEVIGVVSGGSSRSSIYGIVGAHAAWFTDTVTRWSGAAPTPPSPTPTPTPPPSPTPTPPSPSPTPTPTPPSPTPTPTPPGGSAPAIDLISPTDGAVLGGDTRINVVARARALDGVASGFLEWTNGSRTWHFACPGSSASHSCTLDNGTFTYNILVASGARNFRAVVTDRSGRNAQTAWRTITLNGTSRTTGCDASASGWSSVWTCTRDGAARDRCVGGALQRESCATGCAVRPPGVDDVCNL